MPTLVPRPPLAILALVFALACRPVSPAAPPGGPWPDWSADGLERWTARLHRLRDSATAWPGTIRVTAS